jgi:hypothetical protein
MTVEASITIHATKAAVWAATTEIARFAELLSGVEKIEVIEKPATGLVGLKWKETRILFGKPATVEKWITEAKERDHYTTRAEQDGFVFITTNRLSGSDGSVTLTGIHETRPQGFAAKLKALPMVFFKGVIRKAILQDLNDIKAAVEQRWQGSFAVLTPPMLPTRPCSFCLSLQGGSVFADFDTDDVNIVSLRRISYDGYGCCEPKEPLAKMNSDDAHLLLDSIARGNVGDTQVEETLRRYFRMNKELIWSDALAEHDLL